MKHDKKLNDKKKDRVRVDITFLSAEEDVAPARSDDIMLTPEEGVELYESLTGVTLDPSTGNAKEVVDSVDLETDK